LLIKKSSKDIRNFKNSGTELKQDSDNGNVMTPLELGTEFLPQVKI